MTRARITCLAAVVILGALWLLSRPSARLPARPRDDVARSRLAVANLWVGNARATDVGEALAQLDLDLLLLLEWTGQNLSLQPLQSAGLENAATRMQPGVAGVAVLTRGEVTPPGRIRPGPLPGPCAFPMAVTRIPLGDIHVAVLGMHAPPPIPACADTTQATLVALAEAVRDGRLVEDHWPARAGDPVVLLGDLNALPWDTGPRALEDAGLVDAWDHARLAPGPTWAPHPRAPSVARIDYAFVSRWLAITQCWTVDVPGSDHRAVVVDVAWPR